MQASLASNETRERAALSSNPLDSSSSNPKLEEIDWQVDRNERVQFIKELQTEFRDPRQGNKAAEWRLRCKRQANIMSELKKLGKLAQLLAGPMLVVLKLGQVEHLERHSRWRETLTESPLFYYLTDVERGQIFGLRPNQWSRLESAIQSLGHCLCLAVKDLDDPSLLSSANKLKISLIKGALGTDQRLDTTISYIKWLGKSCQFVFLRAIPQSPPREPILGNGRLLPFVGQWSFISDLILNQKRRQKPLTTYHARFLSQVGSLPRALAHPSKDQTIESVKQTVEVFTSEHQTPLNSMEKYQTGIRSIALDYEEKRTSFSHVALSNSAKLEASRAQGGGALVLVANTRKYTDRVLSREVLDDLSHKRDQFGQYLIDPATEIIAKRLLGFESGGDRQVYTCHPTLGDILYVKPHDIEKVWRNTLNSKQRVPTRLAELLNLTASRLIMEYGSYSETPKIIHNVMTFEGSDVTFKLEKIIQVRAGISIESGLKSRLTTSGWAAFAHLSQLPANYMRDYLSNDPFLRTGFLESDKFWEVLKSFKTSSRAES